MDTKKTAQYDPSQIGKPTAPAETDPNEAYLKDFDQRWHSELSRLYGQGKIGEEVVLAGLIHLAFTLPQHRMTLLPLIKRAAVTKASRDLRAVQAAMQKAAGYTHYWGMSRDFTPEEWVKIVQAAKHIVAEATRDPHPQGKGTAGPYYDDQMAGGIVIAGPMGTGTPMFTKDKIALNGTDEGDLSHETFTLTRKRGRDFCKTARKPYDAVVVSILKAAQDIAPDAIDISSDGGDAAFKRVYGSMKTAHAPILEAQGLDRHAVMQGMGAMMYNIDPEGNHSKFYEMLIVGSGEEYILMKRWGALTDSGATGRIDRKDERYVGRGALQQAQTELDKKYREKLSHGYTDAFGHAHRGAPGEYPVGLSRKPGFGWGTQSVTRCIPSLKFIVAALEAARAETNAQARTDMIETSLSVALRNIERLAHEDSTMAQKVKAQIVAALRRIHDGPVFLSDAEGRWLLGTLAPLITYIKQQTAYCG